MGKHWTPEEDKTLLDNYAKGTKYLSELFPGRSKHSFYQRKFALAHAPITFGAIPSDPVVTEVPPSIPAE